jgi:protein MpaA
MAHRYRETGSKARRPSRGLGVTALAVAIGGGLLGALWLARPALDSDQPPQSAKQVWALARDPAVHRRIELGHSVDGRPILAVELGDGDARRRLLMVGCIHGDEPAGIAIARRLESESSPREAQIWVIGDLNPDGVAAGTRQNAHRVDLNRNFPWRWRPLGRPGDQQYSGKAPLSEPESRIARSLIHRLRPQVTIWFHQPLGVTDLSGGNPAIERRFARLTGLPPRRLTRYPGSAASWQNHRLPGTTAFVAELPAGHLSAGAVARDARAVRQLAAKGS